MLQALVATSQTTYLKLGLLVYNNSALLFSRDRPDLSLPCLEPLTFGDASGFCPLACCLASAKGMAEAGSKA